MEHLHGGHGGFALSSKQCMPFFSQKMERGRLGGMQNTLFIPLWEITEKMKEKNLKKQHILAVRTSPLSSLPEERHTLYHISGNTHIYSSHGNTQTSGHDFPQQPHKDLIRTNHCPPPPPPPPHPNNPKS